MKRQTASVSKKKINNWKSRQLKLVANIYNYKFERYLKERKKKEKENKHKFLIVNLCVKMIFSKVNILYE